MKYSEKRRGFVVKALSPTLSNFVNLDNLHLQVYFLFSIMAIQLTLQGCGVVRIQLEHM